MANSADWFAKKMGAPAPQQPNYQQPTHQAPMQHQTPAHELMQEPQVQSTARPVASIESSTCPGCGSKNYGRSPMAPESKARCYDCGYPLVQSGSGMGAAGPQATGGPAIPAKQVATGGWNPQGIIGHI